VVIDDVLPQWWLRADEVVWPPGLGLLGAVNGGRSRQEDVADATESRPSSRLLAGWMWPRTLAG
jgi:hypothetical protein